jgi:hypothetical protein
MYTISFLYWIALLKCIQAGKLVTQHAFAVFLHVERRPIIRIPGQHPGRLKKKGATKTKIDSNCRIKLQVLQLH